MTQETGKENKPQVQQQTATPEPIANQPNVYVATSGLEKSVPKEPTQPQPKIEESGEERIEMTKIVSPPDIITARALAPLNKLLRYADGIAGELTRLFVHKGQDVEGELTEVAKYWHMDIIRHQSLSSPW